MIVFITTGYNENVVGGGDIWVSNFIENIFPLIEETKVLLIDGRPLVNRPESFHKLYTFDNEGRVDALLKFCDKIVFLHHPYKPNRIIQKYLHKVDTTFVHAFLPDVIGLKSEYENLMTRLDWDWQISILDNTKQIVWIGYENDTVHQHYPKTKTITNYYEWKYNKEFKPIISNRIGYAARCETRKNADFLDELPSFVFSNKYDYKRMLEGSKINSELHQFIEFSYKFHRIFFEKNFQIFHGCYMKEPFGYSIFDAVDHGKLPILHTDWMQHIPYKYRATTKEDFKNQYLYIQTDGFENNRFQFELLKGGLQQYASKEKWVTEIWNHFST